MSVGMELRSVGQTDLEIPPVVFGAMARHDATDRERVDVLRAAVGGGLTAIDTAPLYGFGEAERQLALAMKGMPRNRVQILTKVGLRWDCDNHGEVLFEFARPDGTRAKVRRNSRPESVRWEVEQSLARLQAEYLDLVQIHHPDLATPIAETMGALLDLRSQGKLRHIGVSNFSPDQLASAQASLGDVPLCSVQPEYSLLRRGIETAVLPWCAAAGVGVLAYSPLAGGVLGGRPSPAVAENLRRIINENLQAMASNHQANAAAVALAWVFSQTGVTAAITGASNPAQVAQLVAALELRLADEEIEILSKAFAGVELEYPSQKPRSAVAHAARLGRQFGGRLARRMGVDPDKVRSALKRRTW